MFRTLLAVCILATGGLSAAKAEGKPDLSIYGALPMIEDVQISPDGSKLAVVSTDGDKRFLTIRKTAGGGIAGVAVGASKLRGVSWAGEDHVILVSSVATEGMRLVGPPREYFTVSDFDVVKNRQRPLLDGVKETLNIVLGQPQVRMIKGTPHVFLQGVRYLRGYAANTLFRVNLSTGVTHPLTHGGRLGADAWLVDADGEPLAQSTYDEKSGRWTLLMKAGSNWKVIDKADAPMGSYGLAGLGRDGRSALVWRRNDRDVLREYRATGDRETLPDDLELRGFVHDPLTRKLIGSYGMVGEDMVYTFFDPADQAAWRGVTKAFKTDRVVLQSWSANKRKIVVRVDSPETGQGFALVDLATRQAEYLGPVYKNLDAGAISPVTTIRYNAADGLAINAYLTLPKGRAAKDLPLIVLPHGGPEGRDTLGYDWWSQALASRGYAVLRPNFRGSDGFGLDFVKAGFGQWGRKMQTDLSDGVRYLASQGVIDPKRVCIMGASYGGYAALAGATLDKGVYRCAVSVAGVSDLQLVRRAVFNPKSVCVKAGTSLDERLNTVTMNESRGSEERTYDCTYRGAGPTAAPDLLTADPDSRDLRTSTSPRYWLRFIGIEGGQAPDLDAISPAKLAHKADIPVLLIHGKDDTIVPYEHSQIMADALTKAGKPVNLIPLDGEDHWLSRGNTRLKMLTEAVAFVEKHNPPD
ncbi:S9 family peptidase [Caulobacter vibrioides]|uniref:S9 family peptidase n=1 Tax=Caulobacter vibrioides TaxID=155892 RepID=A0A290MKZ8_CAUVI|nr:S9 family peptidase [Caulobacter vibrioides]ATC32681.1 S9 family peptidase [Caulobacter vibrioides]